MCDHRFQTRRLCRGYGDGVRLAVALAAERLKRKWEDAEMRNRLPGVCVVFLMVDSVTDRE